MEISGWHESRLGSGVRLLRRDLAGSWWFRLVIPNAEGCQPPLRQGIAWLTAKMVFGDQHDEPIAGLRERGVRFHCATGRAAVTIDVRGVGSPGWALRRVFDRLRSPDFRPQVWERLSAYVKRECQTLRDDPAQAAEAAVRRLLYSAEDPRSRGVQPSEESMGHIQRGDAEDYFRTCFSARGSLAVALGRFHRPVEEIWDSDWNPHGRPPPDTRVGMRPARGNRIVTGNFQRTVICFGGRGPRPGSSEYWAAAVASALLGRAGIGGALGSALRGAGAAYSHGSRLGPLSETGPWLIWASMPHENASAGLSVMLRQLSLQKERLCGAGELAEAKGRLITDLVPGHEGRGDWMAQATAAHLAHLDIRWKEGLRDAIARVSADEVRSAFSTCFGEDKYAAALATAPLDREIAKLCEVWLSLAGTELLKPPGRAAARA